MPAKSPGSVYSYTDYREFLREYYVSQKTAEPEFSFRRFSKRAGISSPNYLKLVMDGKRKLSQAMAKRFAAGCGLNPEESRYFTYLVSFNQAKTASERAQSWRTLRGFQLYRKAQRLDFAHAAYYSDWFIPAIRELAAARSFREDPEELAEQLIPAITALEARRALDTLLELGLLARDDAGKLAPADAVLSTGPETRGLHIAAFHRAMARRALESIELVPAAERDISSLTLGLSASGVRALKQRLQELRRELLELSALDPETEQVVQLNLQLFPLTRAPKSAGARR